MTRVAIFVDGFNLFHSLKEFNPDCRWLNLHKLGERLINPSKEEIEAVFYFSALATWQQDKTKLEKHLYYIKRLKDEGTMPVLVALNLKCSPAKFVRIPI